MPEPCSIEQAVDRVLGSIEGPIRLGLPLGLGKPNRWVNALYARIKQLPERQLTIYTALCLGRPRASQELQRRFLEPFVARVYGDYPELDFLADLHDDLVPANVRIEQFFLEPGSLLDSPAAQYDYNSCNYSQVARDLDAKGVNLIAQLVARDPQRPRHFSLSCNPDISLDLLPLLAKRRAAGDSILCLAQVHDELPYMTGPAEVSRDCFDLVLRESECGPLFSMPNLPVTLQDQCIGLHASSLVRDGGTLQIGIGALGDALTAALLARHTDNAAYRAGLEALQGGLWGAQIAAIGGQGPFAEGLYGCSEMFVNGLLALAEAGVLRRRVYPELRLQQLAAAGGLDEEGRPRSVQALLDAGLPARLDAAALAWLQASGLLDATPQLRGERLQLSDGRELAADLADPYTQAALRPHLGPAQGGVLLHGGFFLGPADFYQRLRDLDAERRGRFAMTGIGFVNQLYGEEALKRLQRRDARFVNSVFAMTLLGAGVADQLEDGRVLSGVGGQHDFVVQAQALEGARSILLLRSWRESAGRLSSNILWSYGHVTIPRHLRDIVVSEYGIADLRGKTDAEVIEALLAISDSRFQPELIEQAQRVGKLPRDFRLDPRFAHNTPARLQAVQTGYPELFVEYPLGSDFCREERDLLRALNWLKGKFKLSEALELGKAALEAPPADDFARHLARMGLAEPDGWREELYQRLLLAGLHATIPES
ncbi:acetyl-CoA hydrolase/transferase C-terminal domain-containing protein [Pseudomonas benzenivorans]|uniref:acetyl-CoA hydrolase/transferase C-terminal domain-containing protein n=1 Tax=Pseudomonas benzenivorans TaxID=556533 RepID=UPI0035191DD9